MRTPSWHPIWLGGRRPSRTVQTVCLVLLSGLVATVDAAGQPAFPDFGELSDLGMSWGEAALPALAHYREDGIVTIPSWVTLVGDADSNRRGALIEGWGGDGRFELSSGQTAGFAAPTPGNIAPSFNPQTRRTVNMRRAIADRPGAALQLSAGAIESRETLLAAPGMGARARNAAGLGSALELAGGRLRVNGEFAGTRLLDSAPGTSVDSEGQTGSAGRIGANATLMQSRAATVGVDAFHQSARTGYVGGIAPDWTHDGVGTRLGSGPLTFGLMAERRHNNLDHDPTVTTLEERALRPSLTLSLADVRPAASDRFAPGRLIPSAIRINYGTVRRTGTPDPFSAPGESKATDQTIRTKGFAFDWSWERSTTTLGFASDRRESLAQTPENADAHGRSLTLSHAMRGDNLAATLAFSARRSETLEAANPTAVDNYNLSAAFARRNGLLGDMVASFALHQTRRQTPTASDTDTEITTTWQARAGFDMTDLPSPADDGRLTMAVTLNGNDPNQFDTDARRVEVVVGLSGRMRF